MHRGIFVCILISLLKITLGTFTCVKDGLFENLNDPRTFWHCVHVNGYLKPCPTNLIQSQIREKCVGEGQYLIALKSNNFPANVFRFSTIFVVKPIDTTTTTTTEALLSKVFRNIVYILWSPLRKLVIETSEFDKYHEIHTDMMIAILLCITSVLE